MAIVAPGLAMPPGFSLKANVPVLLVQYLTAANQVTLSGSDVTRWNNATGLGGPAATAPVPNPTYVSGAWNGTQPAVQFAATEQALVATSGAIAAYMVDNANPFTLVAAMQSSAVDDQHLLSWTDGTLSRKITLGIDNVASQLKLRVRNDTGSVQEAMGGPTLGTDRHFIALSYTGTSVLGVVDGGAAFIADLSITNTTTDRFYLGGTLDAVTRHFQGILAEARVYSVALDFAQIQQVRTTMKLTWGGLP